MIAVLVVVFVVSAVVQCAGIKELVVACSAGIEAVNIARTVRAVRIAVRRTTIEHLNYLFLFMYFLLGCSLNLCT